MKMLIDETQCSGHGRHYSLVSNLVEPADSGYAMPSGVPLEVDPADEGWATKRAGTRPERDLGRLIGGCS